jgi:hypothetical protein
MVYSKLLNEYVIVANTNDRFDVIQTAGTITHNITLTAGRYRDMIAVKDEIQTQLNAAFGTWACAVGNSTGLFELDCDEAWTMDWLTGTYGTTLRDDLGFTGSETVDGSHTLLATSQHVGGFYPTEPIEADDRPDEDGVDRWTSDTYQQIGRTGLVATKGGTVRTYDRSITFLLPQADLTEFSTWLYRCAQGYSFAFYHNRDTAWDGSSNEYDEYKLLADDEEGVRYNPERVEPTNTIWHRQTISMILRVAPTA